MMQNLILEKSDGAPSAVEASNTDFALGVGDFSYGDLYRPERLRALAETFYAELESADAPLHCELAQHLAARGRNLVWTKQESELLIAAAPHLSRFVARLFRVEMERAAQIAAVCGQDAVFQLKVFVARRALKKFPVAQALTINAEQARAALMLLRRAAFADTLADDDELGISRLTVRLLAWEQHLVKGMAATSDQTVAAQDAELSHDVKAALIRVNKSEAGAALAEFADKSVADADLAFVRAALRVLEAWAAAHAVQPGAKRHVRGWVSFRLPHPLDYERLVQIERPRAELPELLHGLDQNLRRRDGFALT
ncbi:MAG: hypothetical protein M3Q76_13015, partial [Acidobacteriota bacterium]|nr:hypothetical protein [Acidobacteriota bacterium]